ncbi:MAG: hypothetical protein IJD23_09125 [Spirochaetaceae bacterium]|nr:hypothetical protein [Spirochaetaceae bacterium]MBQ7905653.1 hypothetical protein [Spirochaetaceae bacterium]
MIFSTDLSIRISPKSAVESSVFSISESRVQFVEITALSTFAAFPSSAFRTIRTFSFAT